jgi:hypothetical protein
MNLENDIELRDSLKKIKIKITSEHKMRYIDLLDHAIIIVKQAAKAVRDTNDNT